MVVKQSLFLFINISTEYNFLKSESAINSIF